MERKESNSFCTEKLDDLGMGESMEETEKMNMTEETEWVDNAFRMLVQRGIVEVKMENGEEQFRFTPKGLKETHEMIKDDENAQLLIFTLHFNMLSKKENKKAAGEDKHIALRKSLKFMEQFNPDFLEVLKKGVEEGKVQGISLKTEKAKK